MNDADRKHLEWVARGIYEGTCPDAGPDWDLEDALDFVLEHMVMGDFEWPWRTKEPKPRYSDDDPELEPMVRSVLSRYY